MSNTNTEATQYGIELARGLGGEALEALATFGYKGVTGYGEGSDADLACRCAAQDEAKRLTA